MSNFDLFSKKIKVVNIGIKTFHQTLLDQQATTVNVDWRPIANGNLSLITKIERLMSNPNVSQANELAVKKINNAVPVWVDVKPASEAIKLDKYTLLHSGPPISFEQMCVPMKGAVIAALRYEGLINQAHEVEALVKTGKLKFKPCHELGCVGPMTGIISSSMPLICVKNTTDRNFAYSTFNEGAGEVARFGASSDKTVTHLKWIEQVLAPALKKVVVNTQGINLKNIIAQALNMGDELHMRNNASSTIFFKTVMPLLVQTNINNQDLEKIAKFLTTNNDQFFLNFAMAAMKVSADAAHHIKDSTIVTAMARNGVNFGIKVSGLGNQWFVAPAPVVAGLYFPGFSGEDANPDIGDSAIMETGGLGGFAVAAGISVLKLLGNASFNDALNITNQMFEIVNGESKNYFIPNLDFKGVPLGIDILKVVATGITPIINTAIASKKAGGGMIGAGMSQVPIELFINALNQFK